MSLAQGACHRVPEGENSLQPGETDDRGPRTSGSGATNLVAIPGTRGPASGQPSLPAKPGYRHAAHKIPPNQLIVS
ncbi:hypothetical protein RADP37_04628 (plasmid) [Roseomonas mucosa]|uniref:Uncharacterized protein n=1 Tax=Roseomonas mucosa TaxID=207340 RepID=A0A4Y1MRT9_9PROT|nr:hypothetical protein RADP37_04628 [Roseomonas mucosa]